MNKHTHASLVGTATPCPVLPSLPNVLFKKYWPSHNAFLFSITIGRGRKNLGCHFGWQTQQHSHIQLGSSVPMQSLSLPMSDTQKVSYNSNFQTQYATKVQLKSWFALLNAAHQSLLLQTGKLHAALICAPVPHFESSTCQFICFEY